MKKITLNESDILKMIRKVLNEQKNIQFDEDEIDLLHFIFERELKPPFRRGEKDRYDDYPYYNRDGECIGYLIPSDIFGFEHHPFWLNIKYKVCQVFEFSHNTSDWWYAIEPHLKSWMEDQINIKLDDIA